MDEEPNIEHTFGSTTWEWRRVKVRRAPQAPKAARRSRSLWRLRSPWEPTRKLTIQVTYRGGAECYFLLESRGCHGVFTGHTCLADVMETLYNRGLR